MLPLGRVVDLAELLVPPGLLTTVKRIGLYPWGFKGDFPAWEAAREVAGSGYDDPAIARENAASTRALMGRPASTPVGPSALRLLAAFLLALRQQRAETVRVLDFGGALGAHYFTLKPLLPGLRLRWVVCETEPMCDVGREFASEELSFISSLDQAAPADLVVASGSLQYLPAPVDTLSQLMALAPFAIIDRLPLTRHRDRLAIQIAPPWTYRGARMPVWFLGEGTWARQTEGRVVLEWRTEEQVQLGAETVTYRGYLLRANAQPSRRQTQVSEKLNV
jgi:putative methyltransferase (TIGR04325 family)